MALAQIRNRRFQLINCRLPANGLTAVNQACHGKAGEYRCRGELYMVGRNLPLKPGGHGFWVGVGAGMGGVVVLSFGARLLHGGGETYYGAWR